MALWHAIILAIVEGLTEYLPISSTGHLIVTSSLLGINESSFVKDYTVMVQFGAILSVVVLYWQRFLQGKDIYIKLFIAFLPAAVIGLAVKNKIDALLGNVVVVAVAFIIGGVILVFIDRWLERGKHLSGLAHVDSKKALTVGLFQCAAFVPGVSRSAATIVGGLFMKLDRKTAAEFSFLLAVPTLTAATCLKLVKILPTIEKSQITILLIGNLVSFAIGIITVRAFIGYLSRHGFKAFGIYRIALGAFILIWIYSGHTLHML
jgi:undecaprenyl-diphosphatase